jgi:outer membrane protein assembly factor BamB
MRHSRRAIGAGAIAAAVVAALVLPAGPALARAPLTMTNYTPASGPVGTTVNITGTGFAAGDIVSFNGTRANVVKVNPTGTHITTAVPPIASSGPLTMTEPATGQTVGIPGRTFLVTRGVWTSLSKVFPGQQLMVAGSALSPDAVEQVQLHGTVLARGRTDGFGDFALTLTLPWDTPLGRQQIAILDPRFSTLARTLTVLASWPQLSNTNTRSGANLFDQTITTANVATLGQKFKKTFGNIELAGTPVVAGGFVYVNDATTLVASDASTGATAWTFPTGDTIDTTPTVANGIVYDASTDGNLYALGATDGHFIWRVPFQDSESSPLVANGVVYFGTDSGYIYALGATDGHYIWSYKTGAAIYSAPSITKGIVYVGSEDDYAYALNATTGHYIWSYKTCNTSACNGNRAPITVSNGVALVPSEAGFVWALNATTGAYMWASSAGDLDENAVAVANGIVYIGNDYFLKALNVKTGATFWNDSCIDANAPTYANGVLYETCYVHPNVVIYAVDASTGDALNTLQLEGGPVIVAGGRVYVNARTSLNNSSLFSLAPS